MEFLKTWIIPPVVGAIIGYFTNWLAIKMLFRPLKPVYLGKFRLPFTPGILPRERRRLTDSVGETVSRELLTGEVFRGRLEDPLLKERIEEAVFVIVDEALRKDARDFFVNLGEALGSRKGSEGLPTAGSLALGSLKSLLDSSEIRQALSSALAQTAQELETIPAGRLLSPETLENLTNSFLSSLGDEKRQELLGDILASGGTAGGMASSLLSRDLKAALLSYGTKALYARLLPVVEAVLASPELKAELNALGISILRKAISRLGLIQRLIVSAASYERTLIESMPETVQDLSLAMVKLLKDERTAEKLVDSITRYALSPRISQDQPFDQGEYDSGSYSGKSDSIPSGSDQLREALKILLDGLERESQDFARKLTQRYEAVAEKPLGELLPGLAGALASSLSALMSKQPLASADVYPGSPAVEGSSLAKGLGLLENPGVAGGLGDELFSKALESFLLAYGRSVEGKNLGDVLHLGQAEKRILATEISRAAVNGLSAYSERLVDALDIQRMVVQKVDSLDMADAERIVLQVVNKELTWITILGGVLGFLIGFIQSFLSLL